MKKNIIIVIPTLRMGGAEKSLISLLKAMDVNRVNVDLFLFEAGGVLQSEVPSWVNIIEADYKTRAMTLEIRYYFKDLIKKGNVLAAFDRLRISLKSKIYKKPAFSWDSIQKYIASIKNEYDVAIGYLEGTTNFFVLDKIKANRKVGWIHSDFTNRVLTEKEKEYYCRFDEVITISDVCRNAFLKHVPNVQDRIRVLENIVLKEEVYKKALVDIEDNWKSDGRIHIVSVGRLDYVKGMDVAAKVAKCLKQKQYSFCWHVYGQGVLRDELEAYIEKSELIGCFVLEGLKENPYPYMKQADIIVQPSRWEGKSIVLDEAKILGKAIVVTNYPSVTDQVTHEVTGIITGMDPEDIAEGIIRLFEHPELKVKLETNTKNEPNKSYQMLESFYQIIGA